MTTLQAGWLHELQMCVTNALDADALQGKRVAAILGDVPSTYAKSPRLWNGAFSALNVEAVYVPLDVPHQRLEDVLAVLRSSEAFLGGSVTVPYKTAVIPLLDEVDPLAAQIGAVNVIVRRADGRLIGHNTDGVGGVRALTGALSARQQSLANATILLIGAGGAAQALACTLWDQMMHGRLVIANRHRAAADALAARVLRMRTGNVVAITEDEIPAHASRVNVIINATVKGQAGIRTLPDGRRTCLEPYSAIGPANPEELSAEGTASEQAFQEHWYRQSEADIRRNQAVSLNTFAQIPRTTLCYDIIYAPLETVFLRQARWSGHQTLNGKGMNLIQAVEACTGYVCEEWFAQLGLDAAHVRQQVHSAMANIWG